MTNVLRRVAGVVLAVMLGVAGCLAVECTATAATPPRQVHTHGYDVAVSVESLTYTTAGRGPPTHVDTTTRTLDAVDSLSRDASACPHGPVAPGTTPYNQTGTLEQGARPATTTTGHAEAIDGDLCAIQRWLVAANGGSRIAANQAVGNAARDAISAAHPGSLIEQSLGTGLGTRRLDVLAQTGIGIESKVGRTSLTAVTRSQIAKDRWLVANHPDVTGVQWVFSRSGVTGQIGPTGLLADALSRAGIPWSLVP